MLRSDAAEVLFVREDEQLHQQMGLEVIYLLLALFAGAAAILALLYNEARSTAATLAQAAQPGEGTAGSLGTLACPPARPRRPPIIVLRESDGFHFASGSSQVSAPFAEAIRTRIVARIELELRELDLDLVEVVGHTDEQRLDGSSDLDLSLLPYAAGETRPLQAADNVGLGMARAAGVARLLRADDRLRRFLIVSLSAGQTILPDGRPADNAGSPGGAEEARRRVEIRLRRRGE